MKHIFIDLDGTVLVDHKFLPEETINYFKMINKNHNIYIATGRPFSACVDFYNQLELSTPIICDNGGSLFHPKDDSFPKFFKRMNTEYINDVILSIKEYVEALYFDDDKDVYITKEHSLFDAITGFSPNMKHNIYDMNDPIPVEPKGIIIVAKSEENLKDISNIISQYNEIECRTWKDQRHHIIELYQSNITKGSAIQELCEISNINISETIAFGDDTNDIDMIRTVQHGVAMANAVDVLKNSADAVTEETNDDSGVAKYLKNYLS